MNWWQVILLLLGIGVASWLIPAWILGYAIGGVVASSVGAARQEADEHG